MSADIHGIKEAAIVIVDGVRAMMRKRGISEEQVKEAIREAEYRYQDKLGETVCFGHNGVEVIYELSGYTMTVSHARKRVFRDDSLS